MGAYSPGPKDRPVDENWPTHGWPPAAYTREKAYGERVLDTCERDHPDIRLVRLRPGFIFKQESAAAQRRLFAGPLLPPWLTQPGLIPAVPDLPGLRLQALHSADAGEAYRLALTRNVRGAFNIAADSSRGLPQPRGGAARGVRGRPGRQGPAGHRRPHRLTAAPRRAPPPRDPGSRC